MGSNAMMPQIIPSKHSDAENRMSNGTSTLAANSARTHSVYECPKSSTANRPD
jgi:hypothetical protein